MAAMNSNGISPLVMQNRLLSQARSGARARNAAIGTVFNNSSGSNKSSALKSAKEQAEAKKKSSQQEAIKESKENYTAMKKAAESLKEHGRKLLNTFDRDWEKLTQEEATAYRKEVEEEITGFMDDYHSLLKTLSKESGNANDVYLKQLKDYFESSKEALAEIGITKKTDGELSVDWELLKAADIEKLKESFGSEGSFAGKVKERAENIIANAKTNLSVLNSSLYSGNYSYNRYGSDIFDILEGGSQYSAKG